MNVKKHHLLAALVILGAGTEARADNQLSLTNIMKDVMDVTGKAVKGTAHGAGAVIKGTGNAVKNTAHGAGALVEFSEKAIGITPADPAYHAPVAGTAATSSNSSSSAPAAAAPVAPIAKVSAPVASATTSAAAPAKPANKFFNLPFVHSNSGSGSSPATAAPVSLASKTSPASLIGSSIDIAVDRHGNIIDSNGKLVGRVSVITSDVVGTPSEFAGQKLNVTVNSAGEMIDGNSRIIGHILGAEPPLIPKDLPVEANSTFKSSAPAAIPNDLSGAIAVPTTIIQDPKPAASWTEEDILKNTAPIMHGIN
jgi:hypothetical protein